MSNDQNNQNKPAILICRLTTTEGFAPGALQISEWKGLFSIRIASADPEDPTYCDYFNGASTALTPEKALTLYNVIVKKILPAIEKKKETNSGVVVSGKHLVLLGTKKVEEEVQPYFAIHSNPLSGETGSLTHESDVSTLGDLVSIFSDKEAGDNIPGHELKKVTFKSLKSFFNVGDFFEKIRNG